MRRELTAAGAGGEVVVAGALGVLLAERHPTGGLDAERATDRRRARRADDRAHRRADGRRRPERDHRARPGRQPFLDDHRIDGTPCCPGVMGMEGFAEAARALLPGWQVVALEDVELLAPFKFYRDEPRTLELRALRARRRRRHARGRLPADRAAHAARPGRAADASLHAAARAWRARRPAPPPADGPLRRTRATGVGHDGVYRVYFHGPAYQVLDRAWRDNGHAIGRLAGDLPADHEPPGSPIDFVPRLIELCFQTAGVWELGTAGRMALPTHVDARRALRRSRRSGCALGRGHASVPTGTAWTPRSSTTSGSVRVRMEGYRTIELPGGVDADALAPIRAAMGGD